MKKSSYSVIVAINEGFEPQKAIKRLHVLPKNERNCAIFFNFHLIPPVGVSLSVRYLATFVTNDFLITYF